MRRLTIAVPTLLSLVPLQRRYSVVKVESSDMYERGRPKVGGLNDLALGTMDRQERCTTDSANAQVPSCSVLYECCKHVHVNRWKPIDMMIASRAAK